MKPIIKSLLIAALALCVLAPLLNAKRPRLKAPDLVVSASAPHPYGYDWDFGITDDPYLFGPLVLLAWDYAGDEGAFIPYPGYQIYRKVNHGPWVCVAKGIDQREYVDDLAGALNYSSVSYSILTQAPGGAPHFSPVVTFLYLEDWPP